VLATDYGADAAKAGGSSQVAESSKAEEQESGRKRGKKEWGPFESGRTELPALSDALEELPLSGGLQKSAEEWRPSCQKRKTYMRGAARLAGRRWRSLRKRAMRWR